MGRKYDEVLQREIDLLSLNCVHPHKRHRYVTQLLGDRICVHKTPGPIVVECLTHEVDKLNISKSTRSRIRTLKDIRAMRHGQKV